jgi:mandelate racemase
MTRIRSVRARPVIVPMPEPHQTASGTITESPLVLTDVTTDDGPAGQSIVFTYTAAALAPTAQLVRQIGESLVAETAAPGEVGRKLARRFRLLGTEGLVGMALAALDMALWDAAARRHEVSLARLLGATERPIHAYGAVGYDGEAKSAQVAEAWAKKGFTGVKAKIGYPTIEEDLAVVRAIRRAVGPKVSVMVDYNQSLTASAATQRIRALDAEGLTWIEEPTLAHDLAGHARVAREAKTPIQCGENWWGPDEVGRAIDAGASDLVMLDAMKVGGVSGWMRGAALAEARGIPVSSHLWPEVSAQLLAASGTADWLEYADWWNAVVSEPLRIENGMALPASGPGSGVSWNERVVESLIR